MNHVLRILGWLSFVAGWALLIIWLCNQSMLLSATIGCFALAVACIMKLEDLEKP